MAIDPSISLGIRPVEPIDITKLQQIRNLAAQEEATRQSISASKAQEALARAQLPGIPLQQERVAAEIPGVRATSQRLVAEAELARQNQDANNHLIELVGSGKYTTKVKDPVTGLEVQKIDYPRLYGDASVKFPQQALSFAATKAKTDYEQDVARAQAATATKGEVEARGIMQGLANTTAQTIANIVEKSGLKPEEKGREFQVLLQAAVKQFPEAYKNTPYTTVDAAGNIIVTKLVDATDVKKIAEGSMDPLTTARLAISQNELALAQLQADPRYRERLSIIPTPEARITSFYDAKMLDAVKTDIDKGLNANVDFAKFARPGSIVQSAWNTLITQNSEYAKLQRAVDAYNKNNGTQLSIPLQGTEAIKSLLQQESGKLQARITGARAISTGKNITEAAGEGTLPTPAPGGIPRAGLPATPPNKPPAEVKTVKMIKGRFVEDVPENEVNEALKAGWKRVGAR